MGSTVVEIIIWYAPCRLTVFPGEVINHGHELLPAEDYQDKAKLVPVFTFTDWEQYQRKWPSEVTIVNPAMWSAVRIETMLHARSSLPDNKYYTAIAVRYTDDEAAGEFCRSILQHNRLQVRINLLDNVSDSRADIYPAILRMLRYDLDNSGRLFPLIATMESQSRAYEMLTLFGGVLLSLLGLSTLLQSQFRWIGALLIIIGIAFLKIPHLLRYMYPHYLHDPYERRKFLFKTALPEWLGNFIATNRRFSLWYNNFDWRCLIWRIEGTEQSAHQVAHFSRTLATESARLPQSDTTAADVPDPVENDRNRRQRHQASDLSQAAWYQKLQAVTAATLDWLLLATYRWCLPVTRQTSYLGAHAPKNIGWILPVFLLFLVCRLIIVIFALIASSLIAMVLVGYLVCSIVKCCSTPRMRDWACLFDTFYHSFHGAIAQKNIAIYAWNLTKAPNTGAQTYRLHSEETTVECAQLPEEVIPFWEQALAVSHPLSAQQRKSLCDNTAARPQAIRDFLMQGKLASAHREVGYDWLVNSHNDYGLHEERLVYDVVCTEIEARLGTIFLENLVRLALFATVSSFEVIECGKQFYSQIAGLWQDNRGRLQQRLRRGCDHLVELYRIKQKYVEKLKILRMFGREVPSQFIFYYFNELLAERLIIYDNGNWQFAAPFRHYLVNHAFGPKRMRAILGEMAQACQEASEGAERLSLGEVAKLYSALMLLYVGDFYHSCQGFLELFYVQKRPSYRDLAKDISMMAVSALTGEQSNQLQLDLADAERKAFDFMKIRDCEQQRYLRQMVENYRAIYDRSYAALRQYIKDGSSEEIMHRINIAILLEEYDHGESLALEVTRDFDEIGKNKPLYLQGELLRYWAQLRRIGGARVLDELQVRNLVATLHPEDPAVFLHDFLVVYAQLRECRELEQLFALAPALRDIASRELHLRSFHKLNACLQVIKAIRRMGPAAFYGKQEGAEYFVQVLDLLDAIFDRIAIYQAEIVYTRAKHYHQAGLFEKAARDYEKGIALYGEGEVEASQRLDARIWRARLDFAEMLRTASILRNPQPEMWRSLCRHQDRNVEVLRQRLQEKAEHLVNANLLEMEKAVRCHSGLYRESLALKIRILSISRNARSRNELAKCIYRLAASFDINLTVRPGTTAKIIGENLLELCHDPRFIRRSPRFYCSLAEGAIRLSREFRESKIDFHLSATAVSLYGAAIYDSRIGEVYSWVNSFIEFAAGADEVIDELLEHFEECIRQVFSGQEKWQIVESMDLHTADIETIIARLHQDQRLRRFNKSTMTS